MLWLQLVEYFTTAIAQVHDLPALLDRETKVLSWLSKTGERPSQITFADRSFRRWMRSREIGSIRQHDGGYFQLRCGCEHRLCFQDHDS
jgi:hypothetical protein